MIAKEREKMARILSRNRELPGMSGFQLLFYTIQFRTRGSVVHLFTTTVWEKPSINLQTIVQLGL